MAELVGHQYGIEQAGALYASFSALINMVVNNL